MKKIKQLANNAFVRPDRTEVLSEGLQDAERRIDQIKLTCETIAKKIHACLQGQSKDAGIDKRIRKVPEFLLGSAMISNGKQLGDGSAFGEVLAESGQIEMKLGQAVVEFEIKIEECVLKPLQQLMDNDLPNIYKLKRQLGKHTETMDLAKAKLQQASRHSMTAGQGTKIDNIKEEWEDAQQKVEQCRDNLAAEMYALIARESELSQLIVDFLNFQKEYHNSVFGILNELISSVETCFSSSTHKPAYGTDLPVHLSTTQRTIAYPIELCVCGLLETALTEEGLFRMAGSASKVKKLKSAFDAGLVDLESLLVEFTDPHVLANALKCYLRELPEPLLTFGLYKEWISAIQLADKKIESLKTVMQKLPQANYDNLRYLVRFLTELSNHQDSNKMSSANIAIVIAPNLLWAPTTPGDDFDNNQMHSMTMTHLYSSVLDQLILNCNYFFPEDLDFFVTCTKPVEKPQSFVNGTLEESSSSEEQNHKIKRSHSNSSVEEHSPPQGSPKPVLRRKNKPAPVPPIQNQSQNKNPLANLGGNNKIQPFSPDRHNINNNTANSSSKSVASTNNKHNSYSPQVMASSSDNARPQSKEKREGLWIPPSPKDTGRRRVTGGSGGNLADMSISLTPPAKPPPPSLTKQQSAEVKRPFSSAEPPPKPASPLRHKSSFKSNSIEANNEPSSRESNTTDNLQSKVSSANSSPPNASAFSSLPRHFHTDNSYKNQRAPRPPSMMGPPPAPPQVPPMTVQSPVSLPPGDKISIAPMPHYDEPQNRGSTNANQGQIQSQSVQLGFEKVESDARKDSGSSEDELMKVKTSPNNKASEEPSGAFPRPVPAPRSSLLVQSNSFRDTTSTSKEKDEGTTPAIRERPSLMAKPRDLTRRHPSQTQSHTPTSENKSEEQSAESHENNTTSQQQDEKRSKIFESNEDCEFPKNNGMANVAYPQLPPLSPTSGNNFVMPNRPPRPQPPAPPKVKLMPNESTDL